MHTRNITPLIGVLLIVSACSGSFDPQVRTGAGHMQIDGSPLIRVSAVGYFDEDDSPVIDIETDVVYRSLIFSTEDGEFTASAGIRMNIYKLDDEDDEQGRLVETIEDGFRISRQDESIRRSSEAYTFSKQVSAEPGLYRVEVVVTDQDSGRGARALKNVTVDDPEGDEPVLTHVRFLGKEEGGEAPSSITTYAVPARMDSLRFQYKISRRAEQDPVDIRMRMIRFESDTEPPRRMSQPQPSRGSIQYRGINYNEREIIEEQTRTLLDEHGTIEIEYNTPLPEEGAYRFEVSMHPESRPEEEKSLKARDFSIVSPNFPEVKSIREMAQALIYLMPYSDHEEMMEIEDEDSLKQHMDRFWLENIENQERAARVIEKYYNRVEEANRQFTNFKEGWKTDMGMMYVLFGPPYYVDRRVDRLIWIYGYNRNDPSRVFMFDRARRHSEQYPFDHYVLMRDRDYHQVEYRQRQRWLTATILSRPI